MRLSFRTITALAVLAACCVMLGCASDPPPPDLTPDLAAAAIWQKWHADDLNHFTITYHSDTLIECGVRNNLWKLVEVTDKKGNAWSTTYQLTERGSKILSSISLQESGKGHQIMLKGPYRMEILGIADGTAPNTKVATMRWDIDWNKAPEELKICIPRYELSGTEDAVFELKERDWNLVSYMKYLNPDDPTQLAQPLQTISAPPAMTAPQASPPLLGTIH